MLLNEIFSRTPLFESSATVQLVLNHILDLVPDCRAVWLHRPTARAPFEFHVVVHDQTEEIAATRNAAQRIERAVGGVPLRVIVTIESAFEKPEKAMKIYAAAPHPDTVAAKVEEADLSGFGAEADYRAMGRKDARARIPVGKAGLGPMAPASAHAEYWKGYKEERDATRNDPMNVPVNRR
jgi:hypothetical protein